MVGGDFICKKMVTVFSMNIEEIKEDLFGLLTRMEKEIDHID